MRNVKLNTCFVRSAQYGLVCLVGVFMVVAIKHTHVDGVVLITRIEVYLQ